MQALPFSSSFCGYTLPRVGAQCPVLPLSGQHIPQLSYLYKSSPKWVAKPREESNSPTFPDLPGTSLCPAKKKKEKKYVLTLCIWHASVGLEGVSGNHIHQKNVVNSSTFRLPHSIKVLLGISKDIAELIQKAFKPYFRILFLKHDSAPTCISNKPCLLWQGCFFSFEEPLPKMYLERRKEHHCWVVTPASLERIPENARIFSLYVKAQDFPILSMWNISNN